MGTSTRRQFLKKTGLLGGGLTALNHLLPANLFAGTTSFGLPYYKRGAPYSTDLRKGKDPSLVLQGIVYQHDGKTPLKDAVVEIWHCNGEGHFDFSDQYVYRGKTLTDKKGRYKINTEFPGKYKENGHFKMSCIFILVNGPDHRESFSQLYFDFRKNPYIDHKHWAACPMAERPSLPKRMKARGLQVITYDHYLNKHALLLVPDAKDVAESRVRIYPNHLKKESYLTFGRSHPGDVTVRLFNTKKQVNRHLMFKNVKVEQGLPIDHHDLPAGDYTCSIYSNRLGFFTRKLSIG
jgi:protocatechuate 3,4-dioxygenase beta subunit